MAVDSYRIMVEYSIAVCNYNMADTVEQSLRSILDQLDDRFEVVVVDGGSDDGSVDILRSLKSEYHSLRVVELDPNPNRHLGADRQRSIEEARGDYVLPQLDADDYYLPVIQDFVSIYRQLEEGFESPTYLSGKGINIGPRGLLLDVPYRNLRSGEDRDLWRRLFAEDAIAWFCHEEVREEIGYHFDRWEQIKRDFEVKTCDLQAGVDFESCLRWSVKQPSHGVFTKSRSFHRRVAKGIYDLATYPLAYLEARGRPQYETPSKFRQKGDLEAAVAESKMSLSEFEDMYGVSVDRSVLSDTGCRLLDV